WMGTVGGDPEGAMILRDFRRFRVDTRWARVDRGHHSNFTVIFLGPSAERGIVVVPSIRERLPAAVRLRKRFTRARFLYLSPHDLELAQRLTTIAGKAGCRVAVEVEPTANLTLARARMLLRHSPRPPWGRAGSCHRIEPCGSCCDPVVGGGDDLRARTAARHISRCAATGHPLAHPRRAGRGSGACHRCRQRSRRRGWEN